jgi:hypothetical protein
MVADIFESKHVEFIGTRIRLPWWVLMLNTIGAVKIERWPLEYRFKVK